MWGLRKKRPEESIRVQHLTRSLILFTLVFLGYAWACSWAAANSYTTQPGDTLWEVATRYIEDEAISPQQMMLALFHANPGAFVDTNINRLKTGHVLRIPAREEILATRFEDAVTEVAQQNVLWRGNRARLAGTAPVGLEETATVSPQVAASQPASPAPPQTKDESIAAAPLEQPPPAPDGHPEPLTTETFADNQGLRARIATLEERLTKLDGIITMQHGQLADLQQRLAKAQTHAGASTQTSEGREDVKAVTPGEDVTPSTVTTKPTITEKPKVGLRWLADPQIVVAVGSVVLLGLVLIWLRMRRGTVNKTAAEVASATVVQASTAQPAAAEDDALLFDRGDLHIGREGGAEATLAALTLDVDDLELEPDQGREGDTYDGAASHRLPNTASSSRKAGDASP